MAKTATMTIRVDPTIKSSVESIYASYGMTLSDAVNVFLHKSLAVRGLPFDLRPSDETREALQEVEAMKLYPDDYKGYTSAKEMFEELLSGEI